MTAKGSDIRSDLARIRARLKEDLPDHDVLRLAAVVTHFDLFALSESAGDDDAMMLLMELATPMSSPAGAWRLPLNRRQAILARFDDRQAVADCLESVADRPQNRTQRAFETLISRPDAVPGVLAGHDTDAISGLLEAMAWVARAPHLQQGLPDRDSVQRALSDARRMAPLRRLMGDHFSGRHDVLDRMQAYLDAPEGQDVLFIHGPGGIGKSTVLAKFALDAASRADVDAVIYLNLDRPILRPEEPLSLLLDLLTQLGREFPEAATFLTGLRSGVRDLAQKLSYAQDNQSLLESVAISEGDWDLIIEDVAHAITGLPGQHMILVLVDTFEQAQKHGSRVVSEMWRMTNRLIDLAPRLRIIAAGRLEEQHFTGNRVALEAFERSDVERVLTTVTNADLPADLVDDVYELTEGHPLTVQLAASYVGRVGLDGFRHPDQRAERLSRLRDEKRDALLYGRILQQIGDPDVQKIAIPGLVMRRITAGAIRDVLAEPCGLTLAPGEEVTLFGRMATEVDLVTLDNSDPEAPALVHRADVRALMLDDLRRDRGDQAKDIDERAIAYFATQPGDYARAEEIYHRIWRGDYDFELDSRWRPGVAPLLVSALDELPPDRQTWLAGKLRVAPTVQASMGLSQFDWERTTADEARQLLARGDAQAVLDLLATRGDRSPGSALWAIEAEAQFALGHEDAGLTALERGIVGAEAAGKVTELLELLLLRSQMRERHRQFAAASRDAQSALDVATDNGDEEFRLRALAGLMRLSRKSRVISGPARNRLRLGALEMIDQGSKTETAQRLPSFLYTNPGLTRELAAEVGDDHPDLLELSVRQTGSVARPEKDTVGRQFTDAILDILADLETGDLGQTIDPETRQGDGGLIGNLPELMAVARDRSVLDDVKKPLSWLLSAEVDRQVGAFPSKSMIQRTTGVRIDED